MNIGNAAEKRLEKREKSRLRENVEAIVLAIRTFLDVRRREKLALLIGNYEFGYSMEKLMEMRKDG